MNKKELSKLKRSLLALGMAGVILGTSGCGDNDDNEITREEVPSEYYNFDKYCKYVIKDGEALQLYNSQNIMLFYNKETYDVKEYIYNREEKFLGTASELYDLVTEEMLEYSDGIAIGYNDDNDFLKDLIDNNYQVWLPDTGDYIEGYEVKDYYSLEEIKELEPQIETGLRAINKIKVKTK